MIALNGSVLISTANIKSNIFARTVVYVYNYNEFGAQGIILNKPLQPRQAEHWANQIGWEFPDKIYNGGPCERTLGYMLHSSDYRSASSIPLNEYLMYNDKHSIMLDIANGTGPKDFILMTGYCQWVGNQLDVEIEEGNWIVTNLSEDYFFQLVVNDQGWKQAINLAAQNKVAEIMSAIDNT